MFDGKAGRTPIARLLSCYLVIIPRLHGVFMAFISFHILICNFSPEFSKPNNNTSIIFGFFFLSVHCVGHAISVILCVCVCAVILIRTYETSENRDLAHHHLTKQWMCGAKLQRRRRRRGRWRWGGYDDDGEDDDDWVRDRKSDRETKRPTTNCLFSRFSPI